MTIPSDHNVSASRQQRESFEREPIAIIGIGCRFPGDANNPEEFWSLLRNGVDAISPVPADRWQLDSFYDPDPAKPGKTYVRWGGFIKDIDQFDADFFGISPREAARIDPQQRLVMEVAFEAIEDAGHALERLSGSSTGVFIGISTCDYGGIQGCVTERQSIDAYTNLGLGMCVTANRISYLFNFHGPSMAIDTACSSSLVATHLACQSIWNGECRLALVGGVNAILRPEGTIGFSKASMLATDGRCKSFDARANGYVRSEGAGAVLLKPLSRALADQDRIYAVVRGTFVNQDGRTTGIALPNQLAQEAMLRDAYQLAGILPEQVQYVEAHGTGTLVGDPIEANALGNVLGYHRSSGNECIIGSVKSNIGHLEAASGMAGLIKAALCLKNRQIPPNLHFQTPNPEIPFESLRLRVPQTLEPWPDNGASSRLAGVNSFGFGGTNAHVILEEAPVPSNPQYQKSAPIQFSIGQGYRRGLNNNKITRGLRTEFNKNGVQLSQHPIVSTEEPDNKWLITDGQRQYTIRKVASRLNVHGSTIDDQVLILPLSARSEEALEEFAQLFHTFLTDEVLVADVSLSDVCYSASLRRGHHDHRLALVARSKEELAEHLEAFLAGESRPGISSGRQVQGHPSKVVFVFSGMGPQWWAMGRQLLEEVPLFRKVIKQCDTLLRQHVDWSLLEELMADEKRSRINETQIAQAAIFSLQVGLAALWHSWGIEPDGIVGHSLGEVAAAHIAGALTLEDSVRLVFHRSRLQQRTAGQGKMLAVELPLEEAEGVLSGYEERVSIAAINSPSDVTLSGDADALEEIANSLGEKQVLCRFLQVEVPYHSPVMEPLKAEFLESLQDIEPQPTKFPLFSTAVGQLVEGPELDAAYWWKNLRNSVQFATAVEKLIEADYDIFLELSPHPVLAVSMSKCLAHAKKNGVLLSSLRRHEPERVSMLSSLGKLYTSGYPVDWNRFYPEGGRFVQLPSYPWQRERYWSETEQTKRERLGLKVHPLLGSPLESAHPAWAVELNKRPLAYLDDHRVQDAVVYPAAAYVEMALAAARETFGPGYYDVEELALQRAIILPDDEPLTVQLVRDPNQATFDIYSYVNGAEQSWVRNATGKLRHRLGGEAPKHVFLQEIRDRCRLEITKNNFYRLFHTAGLQYGPRFQGVERLWCGEGEALGQIQLHDGLETETETYLLHPTLLDACFQVLLGAMAATALKGVPEDRAIGLYLPVRIDAVRYYSHPGDKLCSYARLVDQDATSLTGDIQLLDDEGNMLAEIKGFQCRAIGRPSEKLDTFFYEYQWKLKARSGQVFVSRPADYLPSPLQMADYLQPEADRFVERAGLNRYGMGEPQLNALTVAYILNAFKQLGLEFRLQQHISADRLADQLGVVSQHRRLLNRMLEILTEDGMLKQVEDEWEVCQLPDMKDPQEIWKWIWNRYPAFQAELTLIRQCGHSLAEVLRGELDPLQLIFPQGSFTTAEHLYQDSPSYRLYNWLAQQAVAMALEQLPEGQIVRILEIGAGTGGMTSYVLQKLPIQRTEYVFTDVTPLFLNYAEQKFDDYPFVQYQLLNIEEDPISQGFEPHSFDLILASDVLHATRDLRQTLDHIKQLLASEGLLILLELTNLPSVMNLVFGLLEGWWRFTDVDLRGAEPWISQKDWQNLLQQEGFGEVACLAETREADAPLHSVILARGLPVRQEVQSTEAVAPSPGQPETWLIFADSKGVGQSLAEQLKARGANPILISPGTSYQRIEADQFQIRPDHLEDMQQFLEAALTNQAECQGVMHFWSLDSPPPEETTPSSLESAQTVGCLNVLYLVQALTKVNWGDSARLWLVTSGTQYVGNEVRSISVAQSPLWGLSRTIANEFPDIRCTVVDLSPIQSTDEIRSLFEELWSDDQEDEIVLRGQARYIHRLNRVSFEDIQRKAQEKLPVEKSQPFSLQIPTPGILDNLTLRAAARREPGKGEVEIQVCAAALNFKDIMLAMGLLPDEAVEGGYTGRALGMECSGKITAIGEGVEGFKIGDEVITSGPGALRKYLIIDAGFVVPKPAEINFEEATTIPIAFLTAYYSLHHLGQMREGDRVLIHAATGGVGLAAIQLAQRAGAEVFATAGTPTKRALLRALGVRHVMDSRSLAFADEVMEQTNGRGVDIVLNSLMGEAIPKSLSVLSPYGRFIELGKIDIYQNSKLGLRPFRNNLSYFAVDLDRMGAQRPDFIKSILREVIEGFGDGGFSDGSLHPISYRLFPISKIVDAFRYMAQAKHIGKVVVSFQNSEVAVTCPSQKTASFRTDGTYLITGGLGGFGLEVAQWLVERGARHLVLVGRSGASSPEAQSAVEAMQKDGVEVVVAKADVTQEDQIARVVTDLQQSMPPLCGIIHAAMVLDDDLLHRLNEERMRKVMAPKVTGAWNLHAKTLDMPLDFFVSFSSFSSIFGTPGQGNYVAANAFLDALAHHRCAQGLPALTVNWGAVGGVGYVAQNPEIGQMLDKVGLRSMPSQQLLKILGMLLQQEVIQIGVADLDWQQLAKVLVVGTSPRFAHLVEALPTDDGQGVGAWLIDAIMAVEPEERLEFLVSHIREQLAKVMGTSPSKVDIEKPLLNLGLDSLMAVEIGNRIQAELGVTVPPVKLMEGISTVGMAEYLIEQLTGEKPIPATSPSIRQETAEQLLEKVDRLSDEEVDLLLEEMLDEEVAEVEQAAEEMGQ